MIEIKKVNLGERHLVIDGVDYPNTSDRPEIKDVFIHQIVGENKFKVTVFEGALTDKLRQCRISDFSQELGYLSYLLSIS